MQKMQLWHKKMEKWNVFHLWIQAGLFKVIKGFRTHLRIHINTSYALIISYTTTIFLASNMNSNLHANYFEGRLAERFCNSHFHYAAKMLVSHFHTWDPRALWIFPDKTYVTNILSWVFSRHFKAQDKASTEETGYGKQIAPMHKQFPVCKMRGKCE